MKYVLLLFGIVLSGWAVKTVNEVPADPNCVRVDGVRYRYVNPCFAACEGYGEDDYIRCP